MDLLSFDFFIFLKLENILSRTCQAHISWYDTSFRIKPLRQFLDVFAVRAFAVVLIDVNKRV